MRALVIDDSRAIRLILRQTLQDIGFEVMDAGNGTEALNMLKTEDKFDLALVDWNMPGMNGYNFVVEVRKNSDYDSMRLMMVTTETETSQVIRALEAGANEYVMKPFTKDVIIDKLNLMGISIS